MFLGHKHIDILKIDIEGWEFDTLTALIDVRCSLHTLRYFTLRHFTVRSTC